MTADEKTSLALFLDLAGAYTGNGYLGRGSEYRFTDDVIEPEAPVPQPSPKGEGSPLAPQPSPKGEGSPLDTDDSLAKIAEDVKACTLCRLCETRTNAVPGEGPANPVVMVIGEGPGADEDATGRPFVGRAGQLLDKMLASIGLSRESNCFIANVIKCRPPANRDPLPDETAFCGSFLERQIRLLKPRFILCAGRISAQTLLNTTEPVGKIRGKFTTLETGGRETPLIATYHPAALIRNEDLKRPAWEDLKMLRAAIDS